MVAAHSRPLSPRKAVWRAMTAQIGATLSPYPRGRAVGIDLDGVGMVDQDDAGISAIAEKDIGAAADDPEGEFELPQVAGSFFELQRWS